MEEYSTALLCTLHLAVGFIAAHHVGRQREARQSAAIWPAIEGFRVAVKDAEPQLAELPQLQKAITQASASIERIAVGLSKRQPSVENARDAQQITHQPVQGDIAEPTREEALTVPEQRRELRKYYPKRELLAVLDDELSANSRFEPVQCYDISSQGISFYLIRPLDCDQRIVITLGYGGKVTYMAGQVCYSRFVLVRGQEYYRIGCRFLCRLQGNESDWKQQILDAEESPA